MAAVNLTSSVPSTFILTGIPGLEAAHIWISIPFSTFYIISLLGNFTVLFVVAKEQTLHKPMYLLLCMMALTDIGQSTCVFPKALFIFWFGFKGITMDGCLTQMFFLYVFGATHSAILVTMAFDRYVAICDPLRYATILTNTRIVKLALVGLLRAILLDLPLPHIAVVKISCGDITVNQMYSLMMGFVTIGLDLTLIGVSYGLIIRAVIRMSSKKDHKKALNTCTAHICVIVMAYTPVVFSSLTHRFGQGIAAHFHILLANLYLLIPCTLNPIIYGVKTRDLRDKMGKYICKMCRQSLGSPLRREPQSLT
uniref:G-protein coupled receptors family 1 profile domain-containing protein n=1 Tax=Pelusios castaneus TaxID=367368 RepID=A0A8C8RLL3_9SAUR